MRVGLWVRLALGWRSECDEGDRHKISRGHVLETEGTRTAKAWGVGVRGSWCVSNAEPGPRGLGGE